MAKTVRYQNKITNEQLHNLQNNKNMNEQTEAIVASAINYIKEQFAYQLKVNHLLTFLSPYNTATCEALSFEMVFTYNLPFKKVKGRITEDAMPINIQPDTNSNFKIQKEKEEKTLKEQIQILPERISELSIAKRTKKPIYQKQKDKGVFALSQPLIQDKQPEMEEEIAQVKKHLYFMRKLRKDNDDVEKARLQQIINRKHLELPAKDYAFDFSGDFLFKKKVIFRKKPMVSATDSTQQLSNRPKSLTKKVIQEEGEDRDILVSRQQGGSERISQRLLFGNSGKRQLSNLPFIKLNDNIKLSQNNRSAFGNDSSRYTLKSYQSRGDSTFRHYSQIEKEKTQRLYSLKRSSMVSELTEDDTEEQHAVTQVQIKRQSKRMQKYLRKLCEDKSKQFVVELNRSSNFNRINSPQQFPVHRYYKHNFNQDKRSICEYSLGSLNLNRSHVKQ